MTAHRHHGADTVVHGSHPQAQSEMNMTPLIDVLLVLLIIFMATLPLSQRGLDVRLPGAIDTPAAAPPATIVLEYTGERRIAINRQEVALHDLESRLKQVYDGRRDRTMFLMAAGSLRYGEIVQVIDVAKGAGVERVGIVTDRMRAQ